MIQLQCERAMEKVVHNYLQRISVERAKLVVRLMDEKLPKRVPKKDPITNDQPNKILYFEWGKALSDHNLR